jgi:hypothetical protein
VNKIAGFGAALLSTIVLFTAFKILVHNETDINTILEGLAIVIQYVFPIIFLGTLLSYTVQLLKISNKFIILIIHLFIGVIIALVVISGIYNWIDLSIFVLVTSITGSIIFHFVSYISNKNWIYFFAFIIPGFSIVYYFFI